MKNFGSIAVSVVAFLLFLLPTLYTVSAVYVVGSTEHQYLVVSMIFVGWILSYWLIHITKLGPVWLNPVVYIACFVLMSFYCDKYPNMVVVGTVLIVGFFIFTLEKIRRS